MSIPSIHRVDAAETFPVEMAERKKYTSLWKLRNGKTVLLRPIKSDDDLMWLEMFNSWSEETIRYRFFRTIKVPLTYEFIASCTDIDYDREVAIVAELEDEGHKKLLGVVRLYVEPAGKIGEIAFVVTDSWQGQGLGLKLVDHIIDISKDKKLETVYAIILHDNYRALGLMKKLRFNLEFPADGTVKAVLNLKEQDGHDIMQKEEGNLHVSI